MHGPPLNLNGIRLKATFSRRHGEKPLATFSATVAVAVAVRLLASLSPCSILDRIFYRDFRRGNHQPPFFTMTSSSTLADALRAFEFRLPSSCRIRPLARSLVVSPAMFSDVTSRTELLFAPFVVCRLRNRSLLARSCMPMSRDFRSRIREFRSRIAANYGANDASSRDSDRLESFFPEREDVSMFRRKKTCCIKNPIKLSQYNSLFRYRQTNFLVDETRTFCSN